MSHGGTWGTICSASNLNLVWSNAKQALETLYYISDLIFNGGGGEIRIAQGLLLC